MTSIKTIAICRTRSREWQEPIPAWHATSSTYLDTAATSVRQYELSQLDARSTAIMNNTITSEPSYKNNEECSLCLNSMFNKQVSYTPCRHVYHTECLHMQLQYQRDEKKECAECRRSLTEAAKTFYVPTPKKRKITVL